MNLIYYFIINYKDRGNQWESQDRAWLRSASIRNWDDGILE